MVVLFSKRPGVGTCFFKILLFIILQVVFFFPPNTSNEFKFDQLLIRSCIAAFLCHCLRRARVGGSERASECERGVHACDSV